MKMHELIELLNEYQRIYGKEIEVGFEAFEYKNLKPHENYVRSDLKNKKLILELE